MFIIIFKITVGALEPGFPALVHQMSPQAFSVLVPLVAIGLGALVTAVVFQFVQLNHPRFQIRMFGPWVSPNVPRKEGFVVAVAAGEPRRLVADIFSVIIPLGFVLKSTRAVRGQTLVPGTLSSCDWNQRIFFYFLRFLRFLRFLSLFLSVVFSFDPRLPLEKIWNNFLFVRTLQNNFLFLFYFNLFD